MTDSFDSDPSPVDSPADMSFAAQGSEALDAGSLFPPAEHQTSPPPFEAPRYANDTGSVKTLPHSAEAERSLLGGMMLSESVWDEVSDLVTEQDFYFQKHSHIFTELARLAEASEPLDVVTLSESLEKRDLLDTVGGLSYLAELVKNTPSAANIRAYAKIVHDRATLRRIIKTASEIQNSAFNPEGREADRSAGWC